MKLFMAALTAAALLSPHATDPGHQPLPGKDGWANGTTGGSAAATGHVTTVTTRDQLAAAVSGDTPKIVYVQGVIDANTDSSGRPLSCQDYATGGYTLAGYLKAYDPATWGRGKVPSGPLESARAASESRQAARVQIRVGANTTIVGVGTTARLLGANLVVKSDNVIIRNLTLANAFDCFPQWDPTDGSTGNWNSLFDNVSLQGATHVWVDHNTFTDAPYPDSQEPTYFGRPFQQHDGQLDLTDATDLVTVEQNVFTQHDKTMLVGNSDSKTSDAGHLRITVHHNVFDGVQERAPRVRFGEVHVYDNLYRSGAGFDYSLGVGKQSQIYAQNNNFQFSGVTAADALHNWGGTGIHATGSVVNGKDVDVVAAFNAANPATPLATTVNWTPTLYIGLQPASALPAQLPGSAGAGHLG
ncbi:pectate lyase family protein [Kutzneria sp. CA-103260]|uniref:pectate lyase family protein n=1 Tax=Kutzneria sp. CA-103260 TaxID=2802641 RepID=UPI001BAD00F2|nr:pectate lyase [Kutzneria sp. CA-103260]QUQ64279.1 pectate lyase [Kutzneria sp. CA-103260]